MKKYYIVLLIFINTYNKNNLKNIDKERKIQYTDPYKEKFNVIGMSMASIWFIFKYLKYLK